MHSAMPSRLGCELGATVSAVRAAGLGAKVVKDLNLNLPTVVISGSKDTSTTAVDGQFIAGKIPGAEYLELDAAHLSNIEAAGPFTAALLKFLEQQEAK